MNKPNLDSAAVTARVISKILLRHDFPRAAVRHRYLTSEGFVVHRVGYAPIVHVGYHVFDSFEGLSEPVAADTVTGDTAVAERVRRMCNAAGRRAPELHLHPVQKLMSAAICFFIAQLGIFAWAIIRIVRNSYDNTDIWRGVRYLFAGWAIVFFLAFLIISGLLGQEADALVAHTERSSSPHSSPCSGFRNWTTLHKDKQLP